MCLQMSLEITANICKCHQVLAKVSKYPIDIFANVIKCLCKSLQIFVNVCSNCNINNIKDRIKTAQIFQNDTR